MRAFATSELLRELAPDPSSGLFLVCGPAISPWDLLAAREKGTRAAPRFMESVLSALKELGVPPDRIRRESYG